MASVVSKCKTCNNLRWRGTKCQSEACIRRREPNTIGYRRKPISLKQHGFHEPIYVGGK